MNVKAVIFFFARSDDTIILSKYSLTIHVCAKKIAILIRETGPRQLLIHTTTKVELISKPTPTHLFKLFPANI